MNRSGFEPPLAERRWADDLPSLNLGFLPCKAHSPSKVEQSRTQAGARHWAVRPCRARDYISQHPLHLEGPGGGTWAGGVWAEGTALLPAPPRPRPSLGPAPQPRPGRCPLRCDPAGDQQLVAPQRFRQFSALTKHLLRPSSQLPGGHGFRCPCVWHTSQPALPPDPLASSSAGPSGVAPCRSPTLTPGNRH